MENCKEKMVRYLYPTKKIMTLMCNDVYQELLEIIPMGYCISKDNLNSSTRIKNLKFVSGAIKGFIIGNREYAKILFEYYRHNNIDTIVYDILIGFVLYISTISDEFKNIDILRDKQSIIYGEIFILDLVS